MALSNWDTLSVNETGESCAGSFVSPLGIQVEIYKNWLYVRSELMWLEGGNYVFPTIAEIREGELVIGDVHIVCRRGPQEGVYAFVWHSRYDRELKQSFVTLMAGCGVYGYRTDTDEAEYIGVTTGSLAFLARLTRQLVASSDIPQDFGLIEWDKVARFNQGDQFFASTYGIDTPETAPGNADGQLLFEDALEGFVRRADQDAADTPAETDTER